VNKRPNLRRTTVELNKPAAPSRIRREPPPPPQKLKSVRAYPTEREVWTVVIGVVLFALAITVATVGLSNYVVN
jgi:hypothetical protein